MNELYEATKEPISLPFSTQKRIYDLSSLQALDTIHDLLDRNTCDIVDLGRNRLYDGYSLYGSTMFAWRTEVRRRNVFEELADAVVYLTSGDV